VRLQKNVANVPRFELEMVVMSNTDVLMLGDTV